jgi:RND family efflux transporter MFP subunit
MERYRMRSSIYSRLFCLCLLPGALLAADNLVTARPAAQSETQSGFTHARTRLVLSAETAGRVASVQGDVGDLLDGEQPFACLDQTFIDLELKANQSEQDGLEVDKVYYAKEVARIRQLVKKNSSSESQLDAAQRNLDKTRVQLESLEIAAQTLTERKQRYCIRPPAGWRVIRRLVEPGEWVNAGEPVVEVGDYRSLLVPFALSQEEYQVLLREKDHLKLWLPHQGSEVAATLLRTSPAFDEASRKIHLDLEIAEGVVNPRGGLRADLSLDIPLRSGAVLVPSAALTQRFEQYWLTRADGEEIQVVYLGRSDGEESDWVRVVSPSLHAGDRLLLKGE